MVRNSKATQPVRTGLPIKSCVSKPANALRLGLNSLRRPIDGPLVTPQRFKNDVPHVSRRLNLNSEKKPLRVEIQAVVSYEF
jgi:hypothetical protein